MVLGVMGGAGAAVAASSAGGAGAGAGLGGLATVSNDMAPMMATGAFEIPGDVHAPFPIVAHGGETVLRADDSTKLRQLSRNIDKMGSEFGNGGSNISVNVSVGNNGENWVVADEDSMRNLGSRLGKHVVEEVAKQIKAGTRNLDVYNLNGPA